MSARHKSEETHSTDGLKSASELVEQLKLFFFQFNQRRQKPTSVEVKEEHYFLHYINFDPLTVIMGIRGRVGGG
jgi:hypothetical protein